MVRNNLILVTELERKTIQKELPHNTLAIASRSKRAGGSSYYVLESDKEMVALLAKIRNVSVKQLLKNN